MTGRMDCSKKAGVVFTSAPRTKAAATQSINAKHRPRAFRPFILIFVSLIIETVRRKSLRA
jgi:hypothetical protein